MALRGQQYRESIRSVVALFGPDADQFVFLGSCVLGLYMRPQGGPFRPTIDTDVAHHGLGVEDLSELTRWHLHPIDAAEEDRVVETLVRCARGG